MAEPEEERIEDTESSHQKLPCSTPTLNTYLREK
jgi:hypothetical protein